MSNPHIQIRNKEDKIHINDLESKHGVHKLVKDGYNREQIINAMYNKTDGSNTQHRTAMMKDFFKKFKG